MLTRLIVSFYSGIIEISLWLFIAIGGVAGYQLASTFLHRDLVFVGGIVGAAIVFVIAAVLFGGFLVIDDIRRAVRNLEKKAINGAFPESASSTESITSAAISFWDPEALMREFEISREGDQYIYKTYRYERLADAVAYAKSQRTS